MHCAGSENWRDINNSNHKGQLLVCHDCSAAVIRHSSALQLPWISASSVSPVNCCMFVEKNLVDSSYWCDAQEVEAILSSVLDTYMLHGHFIREISRVPSAKKKRF